MYFTRQNYFLLLFMYFSQSVNTIVVAQTDETDWVYKPEAGVTVYGHSLPNSRFASLHSVAFSADSEAVIGLSGNQILVFSSATERLIKGVSLDCSFITAFCQDQKGYLAVGYRTNSDPDVVFAGANEQDRDLVIGHAKRGAVKSTLFRLNLDFDVLDSVDLEPFPIMVDDSGIAAHDRITEMRISPDQLYVVLSSQAGTRAVRTKDLAIVSESTQQMLHGIFLSEAVYHSATSGISWEFLSDEFQKETRAGVIPESVSNEGTFVSLDQQNSWSVYKDGEEHFTIGKDALFATVSVNGNWVCIARKRQKSTLIQLIKLADLSITEEVQCSTDKVPRFIPSSDGKSLLFQYRGGFFVVAPKKLSTKINQLLSSLPKARSISFLNKDKHLYLGASIIVDVSDGSVSKVDDGNLKHAFSVYSDRSLVMEPVGDGLKFSVRTVASTSDTPLYFYSLPSIIKTILKFISNEDARIDFKPVYLAMRFSEDERLAYIAIFNSAVPSKLLTIDVSKRELVSSVDMAESSIGLHNNSISANGKYFATAYRHGVSVFDFTTGEVKCSLINGYNASGIQLSPDGKYIAVYPLGSKASECTIYSTENGRLVRRFNSARYCGFSEGSDRMFVLFDDGEVEIYETERLRLEYRHRTSVFEKETGAFNSDGTVLAFTLSDCRVEVWDLNQMKE